MSEERYKLIKENVYTRCHIAEYTGIGLSCSDKEEIELIDYVEELKDQLQQKEIERLNNKEEQLIRRLEDLIIVGEQVENEWAVDICKMIINELKGSE